MTDFRKLDEPIPGVFVLDCPHFSDHRGEFTKLFHVEALMNQGIAFTPAESFLTRSNSGVLRGMHFQVNESAHDKLVTCIKGRVLDVVVDIRPRSPYFNQPFSIELTDTSNIALLIGKGYAHGFYTFEDDSFMLYSTTTIHCANLDRGVLWNSIAFEWPNEKPVLSERDALHPSIEMSE